MSPSNRTYPHGRKELASLEQDTFARLFDGSQKVVVYWPVSADSVTVVGYEDTVSAANTTATANITSGRKPRVAINWWHPDVSRVAVGPVQHPDAREDLPSWIDEVPAS